MPRRSAAWMTVTPSSTSMRWPSISTVGMGAWRFGRLAERTPTEGGMLLELAPELRDERPRRHGSAVGERADRIPLDVVGHVQEQIDIGRRRSTVFQSV